MQLAYINVVETFDFVFSRQWIFSEHITSSTKCRPN